MNHFANKARLTKSQRKAVLCLPEPLIRGSASLMNDPRPSAGLSYMQQLASQAKKKVHKCFDIGGSRCITVSAC